MADVKVGKVWEIRYRVTTATTPPSISEKALYVCAEDIPAVCEKVLASDFGQSNTFKGIKSIVEYQTAILF